MLGVEDDALGKKRSRRMGWVACLFLLVPIAVRAEEAAPGGENKSGRAPVLTVNQLVERALRSNPGVSAKQHAIEAAEAQLAEAKISPYFQFSTGGFFGVKPNQRGTPVFSNDGQLPLSNTWNPAMGVSIDGVIPLYTFGKLAAARNAAKAGVAAAKADTSSTIARLRYEVRSAYFLLQFALDLEQLMEEGRQTLGKAQRIIAEREADDGGDSNPMDAYRIGTLKAEVEARGSEVQRAKHGAKDALIALTGVKSFEVPECPLAPVFGKQGASGEQPTAAKEAAVRTALKRRPEITMLKEAKKARKASLDATKAKYYPDIGLLLGFSHTYSPGTTDQTNAFVQDRANLTQLQTALVAKWSLDFWGNSKRVAQRKAELAALDDDTALAERGIALQTRAVYEKTEDAGRQERAWNAGSAEARAWLVAASQGYEIGTLEARDLVDAVKAYFGARFQHVEAIRSFNTASAELQYRMGEERLSAEDWMRSCAD